MDHKYSLTRQVIFDQIPWPAVLETLMRKWKYSFTEASNILRSFHAQFYKPFNLYWLLHERLDGENYRIARALSECLSADVIVLLENKKISLGLFDVRYTQAIELATELKIQEGQKPYLGSIKAHIVIGFLGSQLKIHTLCMLLQFQAILFIGGIISFVVIFGLLLYSLSVFLVFLEHPNEMTQAATRNPKLGLALICFFVACAAIFGKAARNILKLSVIIKEAYGYRSSN